MCRTPGARSSYCTVYGSVSDVKRRRVARAARTAGRPHCVQAEVPHLSCPVSQPLGEERGGQVVRRTWLLMGPSLSLPSLRRRFPQLGLAPPHSHTLAGTQACTHTPRMHAHTHAHIHADTHTHTHTHTHTLAHACAPRSTNTPARTHTHTTRARARTHNHTS